MGMMKRSLRSKDEISFASSSDRVKSNTCRFSWILEGVTLFGMHATPLCTCHLPERGKTPPPRSSWSLNPPGAPPPPRAYLSMICAGVFWYLRAMASSRGSRRRLGSSAEAQGLSPLPRGLYAVTHTDADLTPQRPRAVIDSRRSATARRKQRFAYRQWDRRSVWDRYG